MITPIPAKLTGRDAPEGSHPPMSFSGAQIPVPVPPLCLEQVAEAENDTQATPAGEATLPAFPAPIPGDTARDTETVGLRPSEEPSASVSVNNSALCSVWQNRHSATHCLDGAA